MCVKYVQRDYCNKFDINTNQNSVITSVIYYSKIKFIV